MKNEKLFAAQLDEHEEQSLASPMSGTGMAGAAGSGSVALAPSTASLLAQQAEHEQAKAEHIAALLKERDDIQKTHDDRQGQISAELMALGYKKPRAARTKKEKK